MFNLCANLLIIVMVIERASERLVVDSVNRIGQAPAPCPPGLTRGRPWQSADLATVGPGGRSRCWPLTQLVTGDWLSHSAGLVAAFKRRHRLKAIRLEAARAGVGNPPEESSRWRWRAYRQPSSQRGRGRLRRSVICVYGCECLSLHFRNSEMN